MSFAQSIRTCFAKYATFSGRASRSEFWWFLLFLFAAQILLSTLDSALFGTVVVEPGGFNAQTDTPVFSSLFSLATLLPGISVLVRRLHDTGRSGWWYWFLLVPVVGFILMIVWLASAGEDGANTYGVAPRPGAGGDENAGGDGGGDGEGGGDGGAQFDPTPIPVVKRH